ncbi:MAG: hypothetical protein J1E80_09035 [Desulfovibrionaceae bacterium]|nr:hypothetical protein [Desulfovibrionaceae bacterium]
MHHATLDLFSAAHDALKARTRCGLTNLFQDSRDLRDLLDAKPCLLHEADKALFLLIPYHETYYDCLYLAADGGALADGLRQLLAAYHGPLALRGSCVGKEPQAGEAAELFRQQGFRLTKKLMRTQLEAAPEKILNAMRPYADEYRDAMSFARPDDAEEIFALLREEFDIVADNLPELSAIREHIRQGKIAVLRWNNTIASLRYFHVHKNTIHNLYDLTRREYRREGFFMALAFFVYEHIRKEKKALRAFGWRDISREKLVKYARESNQICDGVFIYHMLWTPPGTSSPGGASLSRA